MVSAVSGLVGFVFGLGALACAVAIVIAAATWTRELIDLYGIVNVFAGGAAGFVVCGFIAAVAFVIAGDPS